MDDKVKDLVTTALGKIKELSDADTIIGNPIKIDGDITIIPVSKVSYGFAAGGSDLPSKSEKELFGGGSGGGVSIQPLAFIVVANGDVKLLQINLDKSATGSVVNMIPELFDKIQGLFSKDKSKTKKSDTNASGDTDDITIPDSMTASEDSKSNYAGEFDF